MITEDDAREAIARLKEFCTETGYCIKCPFSRHAGIGVLVCFVMDDEGSAELPCAWEVEVRK